MDTLGADARLTVDSGYYERPYSARHVVANLRYSIRQSAKVPVIADQGGIANP